MALDLPAHYTPFAAQTDAYRNLVQNFGPDSEETFRHNGRNYVVYEAERSSGRNGSTTGGTHFHVRDLHERKNYIITGRHPNLTLEQALNEGTRVEVPAGTNPRDIMIRTDIALRAGLTPARAAEVGLLSEANDFSSLRREIVNRGGDEAYFDSLTRPRTPQAPDRSISGGAIRDGLPGTSLNVNGHTGVVTNAGVDAARAGGDIGRAAGRSLGVLGGVFAGAAALAGGSTGAQAALITAEGIIPGADALSQAVQGNRVEAALSLVGEIPVAGFVLNELGRPILDAAGIEVGPSLLQQVVSANLGAAAENRSAEQIRHDTINHVRGMSDDDIKAAPENMRANLTTMRALIRSRDQAQGELDEENKRPAMGRVSLRAGLRGRLEGKDQELSNFYDDLSDDPEGNGQRLVAFVDEQRRQRNAMAAQNTLQPGTIEPPQQREQQSPASMMAPG